MGGVPGFAALRLWLAKRLLPRGYAIWTWGQYTVDGLDAEVFTKEVFTKEPS